MTADDAATLAQRATARPWRTPHQPWPDNGFVVWGPEGQEVVPPRLNWKESCANADLIVYAVNHIEQAEAERDRLRHSIVQADIYLANGDYRKAHDELAAAIARRDSEEARG